MAKNRANMTNQVEFTASKNLLQFDNCAARLTIPARPA